MTAAVTAWALSGCAAIPAATDVPPFIWQTPAPFADQNPEAAAPATPAATCINAVRFLEDLTIPDGTLVAPGETLDKRWSVQNTGTCDWGPDYRLAPIEGGGFGGAEAMALYPARAGEQAVWQVALQAPLEPGEHLSRWQAFAPDGTPFGDIVYLLIEVSGSQP